MERPGLVDWLSESARAQSTPIAYVLLIAMIIIGMTGVIMLGTAAVSDLNSQANVQRVQHTMTLFDSRAALVALGSSDSQTIPLPSAGGTYYTEDSAGWMRVNVTNTTTGTTETIANVTLGAIIYEGSNTVIAYQGGGVWRQNNNNQTRMVSPPEFHYRDATLTLPIISVEGGTSVSGGTLSVQRNGSAEQIYPNVSAGDVNPVQNGDVTVTVHSEYYQGWASYFEDRTNGDAGSNPSRNLANITLTVPSSSGSVSGAVVSGATQTTFEWDNNAEVDSYNSDNGDYVATEDSDSYVRVAGNLELQNNVVIDGDIEAGGTVTINNNAEVNGNVSYGSGLNNNGDISGSTSSDASVDAPESVAGLIDQKVGDASSSNDNSDHSTSITKLENEECADIGGCNLTAGTYYLNTIDMEDTLELDTTSGDITLAVDGDIDIGNNGVWAVEGNNRVNIYMEGDLDMDNNAQITVPGDRAPNFWLYTNPTASADITNNAEMTGVLYGPANGNNEGVDLNMDNNAHIYGAAVGDVNDIDNNAQVHYDKALAGASVTQGDKSIPAVTYLHVSSNRVNVTSG